jgi:hypothetical protein
MLLFFSSANLLRPLKLFLRVHNYILTHKVLLFTYEHYLRKITQNTE